MEPSASQGSQSDQPPQQAQSESETQLQQQSNETTPQVSIYYPEGRIGQPSRPRELILDVDLTPVSEPTTRVLIGNVQTTLTTGHVMTWHLIQICNPGQPCLLQFVPAPTATDNITARLLDTSGNTGTSGNTRTIGNTGTSETCGNVDNNYVILFAPENPTIPSHTGSSYPIQYGINEGASTSRGTSGNPPSTFCQTSQDVAKKTGRQKKVMGDSICQYCKMAFKMPYELTRHIHIHIGPPWYYCWFCKCPYKCATTLSKHYINAHGKIPAQHAENFRMKKNQK